MPTLRSLINLRGGYGVDHEVSLPPRSLSFFESSPRLRSTAVDFFINPERSYSTYLGYSARALNPNWATTLQRSLARAVPRSASLCQIEDLVLSEGKERAKELVEGSKKKIEEELRRKGVEVRCGCEAFRANGARNTDSCLVCRTV